MTLEDFQKETQGNLSIIIGLHLKREQKHSSVWIEVSSTFVGISSELVVRGLRRIILALVLLATLYLLLNSGIF